VRAAWAVGLTAHFAYFSWDAPQVKVAADKIVHRVGMLTAAPSQVAIGENYAEMGLTALRVIGKTVEAGR